MRPYLGQRRSRGTALGRHTGRRASATGSVPAHGPDDLPAVSFIVNI